MKITVTCLKKQRGIFKIFQSLFSTFTACPITKQFAQEKNRRMLLHLPQPDLEIPLYF